MTVLFNTGFGIRRYLLINAKKEKQQKVHELGIQCLVDLNVLKRTLKPHDLGYFLHCTVL